MDEENSWQTEVHYPVLKGLRGTLQGKEYRLTQAAYVIGRLSKSDIIVPDERVSRSHARISRNGGQYLIQDLNSTNGTFVNNLRQQKTVLKHGDILLLGSTAFQFLRPQKWVYQKPEQNQ